MDSLNFGSLHQSLKSLTTIGFENIEKFTQALCKDARKSLCEMGFMDNSAQQHQTHSTIMSIPIISGAIEKLESAKIICSPRGTGIRFSFHYYNTQADLDVLLNVLDDLKI